jgi:hypothetical protein
VAPGGGVENPGERDEHDVGRVGRVVAGHRHERDHRRQEPRRRAPHRRPHRAREEAGALGHPGPEHHRQHVAERVEVRERLRHLDDEAPQVLRGQEALGEEHPRPPVGTDLRRVRRRDPEGAQRDGDDDEPAEEVEEEEDRVREPVAGPLHPPEHAAPECSLLRHGRD